MRINFNPPYYRPSFGVIKLTPEDKDKSEELIKRINSSPIDSKLKDTFAMELYDVFEPYIEKEGRQKAKKSYVVEEVISDIKIKFWEFIKQITNKMSLENLIEKIDEYKPHKTSLRPDYGREKSLDVPIKRGFKKTFKDNLTYDDMPIPLSPPDEKEVAEARNELEKILSATKLSKKGRSRLLKKSRGLSYRTIAKEEGVCASDIRNSVVSSILRLQNDNNSLSPKNKRRIENLAKELNVSYRDMINAVLRNIQLISHSPETVRENVEKASKLFGVSKEELIKSAIRQPSLFSQRPETLNKNAETSSKLFGISKEEFVKAAINQPNLFYQNPETLNKNIETSSKLLGVSREKFIQAAIRCPSLICHKTETINKNIETSSLLFGLPREKFIQSAIKSPVLFCYNSETLYKKSKILNYYKKLQNKSDNKLKITLISYDKLYNNILVFLLKKNYYPKLTRLKIKENLPELLKNIINNAHKVEFEIPEDDVVQDFVAFCEKYSMKTFGENIFKIRTV